jgi:nitroreductase
MPATTGDDARIVLENIRNRRTLLFKHFAPDPILEEHVAMILDAANWAPTHKFTEPWRFTLFTGEGREPLARVLCEVYRETAGDAFKEMKFEKTQTRARQVPLTIGVGMERSDKIPEYEEVLAVGCAVQNMHLMAQALGIGLSWSTPGYEDHPMIHDLLGLTEPDRCFGFLYMGYAASDDVWPTSRRGPVEDKVRLIDQDC